MKIKKYLPVFVLSLALVGCGGDKANNKNTNENTNPPSTSENMEGSTSGDNENKSEKTLTAKEAVAKAKEEYKDYELESISYEKDEGDNYKVDLFKDTNEVSLYIDKNSIGISKEEEKTDDDTKTALDEKYLDNLEDYLNKALEDANKDKKDHYIGEWSLEKDDSRSKLDVEIYEKDSNKEAYSYKIDPENGEILEKEAED